jgi:glucose-specific phosphotransferase system IIA component
LITSPLKGEYIEINTLNDHVFSQELLGKGIAILPSEGSVYAPFDGQVVMLFHTSHAIGLVSDENVELLIHIGIDTVNLDGKYFSPKVKTGEKFKKGELLIEFDLEGISKAGYELSTPVIVTNSDLFDIERINKSSQLSQDDVIFYLGKKEVN